MPNGGMLNALHKYHGHDTSKLLLGLTSLFVVTSCLSSFQIATPVSHNLEIRYTSKIKKPCPQWLRTVLRDLLWMLSIFISAAPPFLTSLAGLIGGIAFPVTISYPSFKWIPIKKTHTKYSAIWCLFWILGVLGVVLSILVVAGAIWTAVTWESKFTSSSPGKQGPNRFGTATARGTSPRTSLICSI